jgi:hypothetical protein
MAGRSEKNYKTVTTDFTRDRDEEKAQREIEKAKEAAEEDEAKYQKALERAAKGSVRSHRCPTGEAHGTGEKFRIKAR